MFYHAKRNDEQDRLVFTCLGTQQSIECSIIQLS